MKKKIIGIISFAITVAVFIGVLKLGNWFPTVIDSGTIREYPNVEAVRSSLGISDIFIPSYFPEPLGWPPAKIVAQKKPFMALIMEFRRSGAEETALVITQAERPDLARDGNLRFLEVNENIPYDLAGRTALIETGSCIDRSPCSRISWEEDGRHIRLMMKSKPIELLRIAESMSH